MGQIDAAVFDGLLVISKLPARNPPSRKPLHGSSAPRTNARCTCGNCAVCSENARWERIFQEKFADPTYYSHRLRVDSTLKWQ